MENRVKPHHLSKEYKEAKAKGLIDKDGYIIETQEGNVDENLNLDNKPNPVIEQNKETLEIKVNSQEPTVPLSVVEKMIADALGKNNQSPPIYQTQTPQPIFINPPQSDIEDIEELKGWELKDRQYILCEGLKPQTYAIANRHTDHRSLTYTNLKTQTVHPLRYSTNQLSFFMDKQTKEAGSVSISDIIFKNGLLKVSANNPALQKFLAIHPDLNLVFKEFDPSEEDVKYVKNKKIGIKANALIFEMSEVENRMIASLVCPSYVSSWTNDNIEKELLLFNEKSPQRYIELTEDPTLKSKGVAKSAMDKGILIYDNTLYRWLNSDKKVLVEVPKNKDEYDVIVSYFGTEEGRVFLDYLHNS